MNVLERYILRRLTGALIMIFVSLSAAVWVTQALRQFDLVTVRGQSLLTFLVASSLLLPLLVMIVMPVALLIAVTYTLNSLNSDSELAIINASGARQRILLKPVTVTAVGAMIVVAACSLYITPFALRQARGLLEQVNADILGQFIREGQFLPLGEGVVLHIKKRNPDGTLDSIFVSDKRDEEEWTTYLARRGQLTDTALGRFLFMEDGVIHRQSLAGDSSSLIEFAAYAFDLTTFGQRTAQPTYRPAERPTEYLFNPDPEDPIYQQNPDRFVTELHTRLSMPLYVLIFAYLPLAFLGQAQSTRKARAASITLTTLTASLSRATGVVLSGAAVGPVRIALLYLVPIVLSALAIWAVHTRFPLTAADSASNLFDRIARPFAALRPRRPEAQPAE
jgi:lipopolysaccharide export system permease protein